MSNCSNSVARGGLSARLPNPRAVDSAMFLKPRMVRAALACLCRPSKRLAAGSPSGRCCAEQSTNVTATSTKPTCAIDTFFMLEALQSVQMNALVHLFYKKGQNIVMRGTHKIKSKNCCCRDYRKLN